MRRYRLFVVPLLAVAVLLTGCGGGGGGGGKVPEQWIADQYRTTAGGYRDPDDRPAAVARAIHGHRKAKDRVTRGGREYLRYKDDIVAITPLGSGSKIEIDDYARGYRRWRSDIGSHWPDPGTTGGGFRGGGSGSGK